MPTYDVKVVVTYEYEVEAENEDKAELQGWLYEEHAYSAEVYSIDVEELTEDDQEVELDKEVVTDFSNVCDILGELYANYRDDDDFKDFIHFNDLGLPLAYLTKENLAVPSDDGVRHIMETWEIFLKGLNLEDKGFTDLDSVLEI